ncbi:MAG: serine/threonine-protein kinase [Cyanobacteria bacterium P01_D01_bin.44]
MKGQIFQERYCIQRPLGQNTARRGQQTYLALDKATNQPAAVKILRFGPDFEWEHLKLFQREAAILQTLNHPAIPRYLDSFEINTPDYQGFALVQTYIDAPSLEDHLRRGRTFSIAEVVEIAKQLLAILNYLHSHHPAIIHRDIKPSNVLLRDRTAHSAGAVYLVDFGSVQNLVAVEGGTITVVGTYGYMPPEQFGGRTVPASDLYSLGATLIYLITGIHPANLPQRDLRIHFEATAAVEAALGRWLRHLIEPSLDKRFDSANQALAALKDPAAWERTQIRQRGYPENSSIRLKAGVEALELHIPSPRLSRGVSMPPLSGWGCIMAFFFWWIWAGWIGISWGSHLIFGVMSLLLEKQIVINQSTITLKYKLLALITIFQKKSRRRHITMVELLNDIYQQTQWGEQEIKGEIIIWAGNDSFRINKLGGLTPPEIAWLAGELEDWLGLQISTRPVDKIAPFSPNHPS